MKRRIPIPLNKQPYILQKKLTYYKDLVDSGIVNDSSATKKNVLNLKVIEKNSMLKYYRDLRDSGLISNKYYINIENHYNKIEQQQQNQQQNQQPKYNSKLPVIYEKNNIDEVEQNIVKPITDRFEMGTYFDKIYISNLERRTDRLEKLKNRLKKNNITNYQIIKAYDGNNPRIQKEFQLYLRNEKNRINSSGALAYLYTMRHILTDAINNNYDRILICDDDILFHKDFSNYFDLKIKGLNNFKWKLLYLGGMQLKNWNKIKPLNTEYYLPNGTMDGSFSVGIDKSILGELLQTLNGNVLPFDTGPLRFMQMKYTRECLVMYPNIMIADSSDSDIQNVPPDAKTYFRDFCNKCKWDVRNYDM